MPGTLTASSKRNIQNAPWRTLAPLLLVLLVGLAMRLLLWERLPRTGLISDEGEYLSAANWLAAGRGFAWHLGYLWTRAPLYPLFLAVHLRLFGDTFTPIFLTQTILSLVNVVLVYLLALRLLPPATGWPVAPALAALLMAIYLPYALYAQTLLSETLYLTLLLGGFVALAHVRPTTNSAPNAGSARRLAAPICAGILFGLATLTRGLTLPFLPVVVLWLLLSRRTPNDERRVTSDERRVTSDERRVTSDERRSANIGRWSLVISRSSITTALLFALAAGALLLPWVVYNSRLYGGPIIVDTTGGFNLLVGARTAYDGSRSDALPRNFVLALLDGRLTLAQRQGLLADARQPDGSLVPGACLYRRQDATLLALLARPPAQISQYQRQQLMLAEALCLISERPTAFIAKSFGELIDLFQINYSGDERFADGFTTGRLPPWYSLSLLLLDDTLYVLVLPLAVFGVARLWRLPLPQRSLLILIGLWWLYNLAAAPLLFAINRFRLPLLPFVFIGVAALLVRQPVWTEDGRQKTEEGSKQSTVHRPPSTAHRLPSILRHSSFVVLAALLFILAATPFAGWLPGNASYFGPGGSLAYTQLALAARPAFLRTAALRAALADANPLAAQATLDSGPIRLPRVSRQKLASDEVLVQALIAAANHQPATGLALLPTSAAILAGGDVEAAIVRADLLRTLGEERAAKDLLTPRFVDSANPVRWAWDWLRPLPTSQIDLGGNLDLGYIDGCYLGEPDRAARTTFRWCGPTTRLRFPAGGRAAQQQLVFSADRRGWPADLLPAPPVHVLLDGRLLGSFSPATSGPGQFSVTVPPTSAGADLTFTLVSGSFIPDAARYLSQQGSQAGQAQPLALRLDMVELRP